LRTELTKRPNAPPINHSDRGKRSGRRTTDLRVTAGVCVSAVVFSPNGKLLASSHSNGTVRL
jgi:hypothetical protein